MAEYEANLSDYGFPLDEVFTIDADPNNKSGTHTFVAHSRIPWDARVVAEAQKALGDDEFRAVRQWTVEKVER